MNRFLACLFACLLLGDSSFADDARSPQIDKLIDSSCLHCHDESTETGLNFESLHDDLTDPAAFRMWRMVLDRAASGEMPPESEPRPEKRELEAAISALSAQLRTASLNKQAKVGRVPARRLTKSEFGFTIQDLLEIDADVTSSIPDEVESGVFDCIGANQRISAVHMESYLRAADEALDAAIKLGRNPYRDYGENNFAHLHLWHDKPLLDGGSVTRPLKYGPGVVLFRDIDYLTQFTFNLHATGTYRLTARVAAFQSAQPITAKVIVKNSNGAATLVSAVDLPPGDPRTIEVETFLHPGDVPYLTYVEPREFYNGVFAAGGAKHYQGPGLAILSQSVEGPINQQWPPTSTRELLYGVELVSAKGSDDGPFQIRLSQEPIEHIRQIVRSLAPRVFRRPVPDAESERFVELAEPAIAEGRDFLSALRVPLRSMLSSPQFLVFEGEAGKLDDHALATRLSYFLWKSLPDDELMDLAEAGRLSEPEVLRDQVERMLSDPKSDRFVNDFVGQWLRVDKVNATTPDDGLYPEFDEVLSKAIPRETQLFFGELVAKNLSLTHLIDSDFTFVNRRLAEHYGLTGVVGQHFRRVELKSPSIRGGVLTQAAILKTTANGTTTSPVTRGNFVLTNFLGTPPSSPPPGVGSIEPDTRGKTTIREILAAHRDLDTCNVCHKKIDPPGFALESFDPIGGFREFYRVSGGEQSFDGFIQKLPPKRGPAVDPSGETSDGRTFSNIQEFKRLLLDQRAQVARNFVSQLVVYATGGEIEFADLEVIDAILSQHERQDYPVRDLVHAVVQSRLFLNQ